jgi:uncharacterized alkaline shock family protein YloU
VSTPAAVPPDRIRVTDALVARVAAHAARTVTGVTGLSPDPGPTLRIPGGPVLGPDALRPPPPGAGAVVQDGSAEIALTVRTRLGYNCRDLAVEVQRSVAAAVHSYTGLAAVVTVTIAEIALD